ncbi:MAG: dockerin type I repeat-containing protein [Ruminococcus sp.]|nr:dockerin type I repeat-containing protein [Ruminococcus sp.]
MKKLLSIFLTAALLLSVFCQAGAFSVSALENEEITINEDEFLSDDKTANDDEIAAGDAVYSVIGTNIFYYEDDIYDTSTNMTYDPNAEVYKLRLYAVHPRNDVRIKIVKNHSIKEDFDIQSTYYIFDIVSTCDILITFDPITHTTNVYGKGVVPFNVRKVVLLGFGNGAFNWDYTSEDDLLTEVEKGVWEITYKNVMTSSDPYCQVYFGVNPTENTKPNVSYGFGNPNNEIVSSGVETDASILGSRNIAFKVEKDYSTVNFRLDVRNFDPETKTGAKFTVTVTPPAGDVYSVALMDSEDYISVGAGTLLKPDMTYNESTALYTLTVKDLQPQTDYYFYLLKNYAQIPGKDGWCSDYPIFFYLEGPCDVTFTFEPLTGEINVYGESVAIYYPNLGIFSVIAAGNGEGNYLNGANYDPCDTSNAMEEVADGIFELTMTNVEAFDNYNVKFAVNSIDEDNEPAPNPWQHTFGAAQETECPAGQKVNLVYGGSNCIFSVPQNGSTVKFRLNLRNFNFATKKGAKLLITVTPPVYGVQVVNTGFYPDPDEVLMTYNEETGLYELTAENVEPQTVEFYVVKDHVTLYGDYYSDTNHPYKFKVDYTCDVTITFDPETETVTVQSDGIFTPPYLFFSVYSVIAAGNGEGDYLDGSNWDPCDTANALEEIEEGVWQLTMKNIDAFDNYQIKFVVNSVDEDGNPIVNPWEHNFGTAQERQYPADEEIDAVYNGSTCIFSVPDDHSTVTFTLDLRNFDIETKQGAKLMINVEPPEPEWGYDLGDVNGDGVVDVLDAALIQKFAAEKAQLTEEQKKIGDFNGDGHCDVIDATAIQKSLVY